MYHPNRLVELCRGAFALWLQNININSCSDSKTDRRGSRGFVMSGLQRRKVHNAQGKSEEREHAVGSDPAEETINTDDKARLTLMEEVVLLGIKDQQGYLSFWNDSLSYVLRGCIILELALRRKIAVVNDPGRRRMPIQDRVVQLVDDRQTGEPLLDETIKLMKTSEPLGISTWIDYLSGETWNLYKIGYQLKQVRERLQKGLVDKGVLRTDKMNFLLFDMPTHPVADATVKDEVKKKVINVLTLSTPQFQSSVVPFSSLRTVALTASAYAGNVLENVLGVLSYSARDAAFLRADEILNDYGEFPFERRSQPWANALLEAIDKETKADDQQFLEVVAGVLRVYSQLDVVL